MAKNLKIKLKNTQIAAALNLGKIKKGVLSAKKKTKTPTKSKTKKSVATPDDETIPVKRKARIITPKEIKNQEIKTLEKEKILKKKKATSVQKKTSKQKKPVPVKKKEPKPTKETLKKEIKKDSPLLKKESKSTKEKFVEEGPSSAKKPKGFKEFKEFRNLKKDYKRPFDARDRQGLRSNDDERWRKARFHKAKKIAIEEIVVRPSILSIKLPIQLKDLAQAMKLKASEIILKLFSQGVVMTINDILDDETTVQLLGHEFGCEITIDTSEEERLRITDKTIKEEIISSEKDALVPRAAVVTFMGHVDHGKTSLIDAIRKSNLTAQEAGYITQHIGAFRAKTPSGDITILDTPGHEAFSEMRERGANVTDIVALVIAGDEGMRNQTIEALQQAKDANVPIVVIINKCDKANFDADKVYRQLADHELLPETWGGTTITVNCSAITKEGIPTLLEMLSLQAEILELQSNPSIRARGTVLESQMHKGLGAIATVLIQNGTLHVGDGIVFGQSWGRVKTMHNEKGQSLTEAGPSFAVKITGLSNLAYAGDEFIVVKNEKEARALAEARTEGHQRRALQQMKRGSLDHLLQESEQKKILTLILRADVQGSLEALRTSLMKIQSNKIELNIVSEEVGEISESDIQLALASKATIIGFHTRIESHAEDLSRDLKADVRMHDVIYHAIDDVTKLMVEKLDKIAEEKHQGTAEVKALFKSSQVGTIAGCQILDGMVKRNDFSRIKRNDEILWNGKIASLKREKEDIKEVQKGFECGIVLEGFKDIQVGDIIETYGIIYKQQEL